MPAPYRSPQLRQSASASLAAWLASAARPRWLCAMARTHSARPCPEASPNARTARPPPVAFARTVRQVLADLRFGETKQAQRDQWRPLAPARGPECRGGRRDGRLEFALARLHQGPAVLRLRHECGRLGALGKAEHRVGIGAGAVEVALGDEALRAQVQQVEPVGNAQARCGQGRRWRARWPWRAGPPMPGRPPAWPSRPSRSWVRPRLWRWRSCRVAAGFFFERGMSCSNSCSAAGSPAGASDR